MAVTRVSSPYSYTWFVTFRSSIGDLELFQAEGCETLRLSGAQLSIHEHVKGKDLKLFSIAPGLSGGSMYVARLAAINAAGVGEYTDTIQSKGKGLLPVHAIPASTPGKPKLYSLALSNSQISLQIEKQFKNENDIDLIE